MEFELELVQSPVSYLLRKENSPSKLWRICSINFIIFFSDLIFLSVILLFALVNNGIGRQHPTRHQLYCHLPPITKTIQVRRTRHAGHWWRSRDVLISDVLRWTPTYGRGKAGWPARTYIQQLCEDTGCSPEDLPGEMNYSEKWRERVSDIRAGGTTWWWWWWWCSRTIMVLFNPQLGDIRLS